MPYSLKGNCVVKTDTDEPVPGGCHKNHEEALAHLRALEANVKNSGVVEMSMRIHKASYNKSENEPMKWAAVDSDIDEDLFKEKMSVELYKDFTSRIDSKTPIPDEFHDVICEADWCGGMPYLSIAHYKAGTGLMNVPGSVDAVYIDGTRLKSKGTLHDNEMGRKVFQALREDLYMKERSDIDHLPVRISIGFLDLEHKHVGQGGQDFTFTRSGVGQICPLCSQGIGGKIYMKGQLVHLAMTRVPVNPRTEMIAEKSMGDEITTKRDDAKSIIGELADELEEKSAAQDILVVRSDDGSAPQDDPNMLEPCYDPTTDSYNQDCVNRIMDKLMPKIRDTVGQPVKSKSLPVEVLDAAMTYLYKSNGYDFLVEDAQRKDVSPADKKRAEKEYGDVKFADETNKKYPIDTKEHAKAALSYWGMPKNREKYSPEEQKKIGGRIRAAAKKFGIEVTDKKSDTVEEAMTEQVEKMVAGGESIPEKKFDFAGLDGAGNNTIASPVKAKAEDEGPAEDTKGDEPEDMKKHMKNMSILDTSYAQLKSVLASASSVEEVQKAFNELGTAVEKSYAPPAPKADDIAAIVKSAVEAAVAPLRIELATLKAQKNDTVSTNKVQSKALSISSFTKPEQMIQRATQQPVRDPNDTVPAQIRALARKSTLGHE